MKRVSILDRKTRYLQIALNGSLDDARRIIPQLPRSERIILEAGTPLIKRFGEAGIRNIVEWYSRHLQGLAIDPVTPNQVQAVSLKEIFQQAKATHEAQKELATTPIQPYVVADLKMMDRGHTEVDIAHNAGATAAVALGNAPIESLNSFIMSCKERGMDSMVDMMNVSFPLSILRELDEQPTVVILHRGVDETDNKEKILPLHEIRRIKGSYDTLISVAGGDTIRDVQRAMFNDADIAVVWKSFYQATDETSTLAKQFLAEVK